MEIVFDFKYLKLQEMKALHKKFIYDYSLKYRNFAKAISTKVKDCQSDIKNNKLKIKKL